MGNMKREVLVTAHCVFARLPALRAQPFLEFGLSMLYTVGVSLNAAFVLDGVNSIEGTY